MVIVQRNYLWVDAFRTTLPVSPHTLKPKSEFPKLKKRQIDYRAKMKANYDYRHRAHEITDMKRDQSVIVRNSVEPGIILERAQTPRSYIVKMPNQVLRLTSTHLKAIPVDLPDNTKQIPDNSSEVLTKSGRIVKTLQRLDL